MRTISDLMPLVSDVKSVYILFRRQGKGREQAIRDIMDKFAQELSDEDDAPQVQIGLAAALAQKQELTSERLSAAIEAFDSLANLFPDHAEKFASWKNQICSEKHLGPEARYPRKRFYDPKWEIGDTFVHPLHGEYPKKYGLDGFCVLLRVAARLMGEDGDLRYQMYLTVCKENSLPQSSEQLEALGYLPFSEDFAGYEYRASLHVTSKKKLERFSLEKIGNYPIIVPPKAEILPKPPITGWPLLLRPPGSDPESTLDIYTCWNYQRYGIVYHETQKR